MSVRFYGFLLGLIMTLAGCISPFNLVPTAKEPDPSVWLEEAGSTYVAIGTLWLEKTNDGASHFIRERYASAYQSFDEARALASDGRDVFRQDHRSAPDQYQYLYNESVSLFNLLEASASASADCADDMRRYGEMTKACEDAGDLGTEAMDDLEWLTGVWKDAQREAGL